MTLLAILALGFFLGMRHATDSDHVLAVTAIVSRARSARAALWVGGLWGLGHTATILTVGGAIVLFGWVIPARLGLSLEMSVAVMLIALGAMNLSGALRRINEVAHGHRPDPDPDPDGNRPQVQRQTSSWDDEKRAAPSRKDQQRSLRPLLVGVVHGLAGSAAIALLVLTTMKSAGMALVYLALFGAGTMAGMMLLTLAMALPLSVLSRRLDNADQLMGRVTGLISIAFGLFLAYRIGVTDGLLFGIPHWSPR